MMNRRAFAQTLARTVAGAYGMSRISTLAGEASILATNKSEETGVPFNLSVMLWTVFTNLPFEQRLEKIAEAGFRNIELVGEYDKWTESEFRSANAKRQELAITFDCTAGLKHGVSIPDHRQPL